MQSALRTLAVSATLFTVPAMAADIIHAPSVEIEPGFTWTGAYVGVQGGWLDAFDVDASQTPIGSDITIDAYFGGIHAGYNVQFDGVVVGVYADVDMAFTSSKIDLRPPQPGIYRGGSIGEADYVVRGLGKAGFALDRTFGYVQGGFAYLSATANALAPSGAPFITGDLGSFGYAIGAGVDFAVTPNVIVGGDYLYHRFSNFDNVTTTAGATVDLSGLDVTANTFRGKIAYKF